MRAVVVTGFGDAERLTMTGRPDAEPGTGDVVIRAAAVGLNPMDWKLMEGQFRFFVRQKPPYVPGFDVAGTIETGGAGADPAFQTGERVVGSTKKGGALAELVAVERASLVRIPERLSWEDAAAVPGSGCTALQALRDVARMRAGARVLVNGASGGVGTFAVQVARVLGADVDATTSASNIDLVRGLGALRVYDYEKEDFAREAAVYDVVFDAVAKRAFGECRRALKPGGVYMTTLPNGKLFWDIARTTAFPFAFGGRRAAAIMARPNAGDTAELLRWVDEGKIRPIVDRVVPMEIAAVRTAFEHLRSGRARGKVVVRVGKGEL